MLRFVVAFALFVGWIAATSAAELVMVERPGCPWCEIFDREIAPIYGKTPEAQPAPLRRIQLADPVPQDLSFLTIERWTPLLILVDGGREIGRIRGYPGPDGFWTQLAMLMDRLPHTDAVTSAGRALPRND